ncbi:MAG: histidinol-phosphatase HisJ family protein [Candidatus Zixiibacteriota bacterium]
MPSDQAKLTPLPHPGLADYHCHCGFSADAAGAIDEYCEAAIQRGLAELCFVTHYDSSPHSRHVDTLIRINGRDERVNCDNLALYVDAVRQAHEKYYPAGLSVKLGIEISWWDGCADDVVELRRRYEFDHVLCGLHELDGRRFVSPRFGENFEGWSAAEFVERYYSESVKAARTGLFDAMAHLAYYLRFGVGHYGDGIYTAHRPFVEELFTALRESETALEINTAAIRHGFHHYYPPMDIINAAGKAGVAVRFLGSDAHRPEQVGFDFEAAAALIPDTIAWCDD